MVPVKQQGRRTQRSFHVHNSWVLTESSQGAPSLIVSRRSTLPRMCLLSDHCALWYCCLTCFLHLIIHCYRQEEYSAVICRKLRVWLSPKYFHSTIPEGRGRKQSQARAGRDFYSMPHVNQLDTILTHVQLSLSWSASPWDRIWKHFVGHRSVGESEESTLLFFCAVIALANMVNIPKTHRTFCKKCGKHQPHKVTQYKQGKDSLYARGNWRYDRKQSGYGGQATPIFRKKAKTAKKIVLSLECVSPTADQRACWLLRDASILRWEVIKRERAKWSSFELHILFYYEDNKNLRSFTSFSFSWFFLEGK